MFFSTEKHEQREGNGVDKDNDRVTSGTRVLYKICNLLSKAQMQNKQ